MEILSETQIQKLNDRDLYQYCQDVGKNARMWKNRFIALLPEVARRELYKKKFHSIYEFAAKVGGISNNVVNEVIRVDRKLEDKPVLKAMISKVGLHKVRIAAGIATKENQKDLAEKVQKMSKKALEMFTQNSRKSELNEQDSLRSHPGMKITTLSFQVSEETDFKLRKIKQKYEKKIGEKLSWEKILKILIEKDEEKPKRRNKVKKPSKVTHQINAAKKHELEDEYNGQCAFPSCNNPSEENHHPERYSRNKSHENVKPLCKTHHELAHHGMIKNEELDPKFWEIQENPNKNDTKNRIDLKVIQMKMEKML